MPTIPMPRTRRRFASLIFFAFQPGANRSLGAATHTNEF
jgi:hypothetical protein